MKEPKDRTPHRRVRFLFGTVLGLMAPLIVVSCVGLGRSVVDVEMGEGPWSVAPETLGDVNVAFRMANNGSEPHQPVVIKTDIPPDELPISDGQVNLANIHIYWPGEGESAEWPPENVDELFEIVEPGETLQGAPRALGEGNPGPGTYVVFCYLPEHYERGEHGRFALASNS